MIEVEGLAVRAGGFRLEGVSLSVAQGEYAVLMGRTGTGKTTLLEVLAGLRPAAAGRIVIGGRECTGARPADRGVGYVPQDGALFTTMTVEAQLGFGPRMRGWSPADVRARVSELAGLLGLTDLLPRRPRGLSGGERQRVALGRALSFRPGVLLLDEPLSALDEETREEMYALIRRLRDEQQVTALHVTHSTGEAERLADRVFRLEGGAVRGA